MDATTIRYLWRAVRPVASLAGDRVLRADVREASGDQCLHTRDLRS